MATELVVEAARAGALLAFFAVAWVTSGGGFTAGEMEALTVTGAVALVITISAGWVARGGRLDG